jgi:hypothetical protein
MSDGLSSSNSSLTKPLLEDEADQAGENAGDQIKKKMEARKAEVEAPVRSLSTQSTSTPASALSDQTPGRTASLSAMNQATSKDTPSPKRWHPPDTTEKQLVEHSSEPLLGRKILPALDGSEDAQQMKANNDQLKMENHRLKVENDQLKAEKQMIMQADLGDGVTLEKMQKVLQVHVEVHERFICNNPLTPDEAVNMANIFGEATIIQQHSPHSANDTTATDASDSGAQGKAFFKSDTVEIAQGQHRGKSGTIVRIDSTHVPYQVQLDSDEVRWFAEDSLKQVYNDLPSWAYDPEVHKKTMAGRPVFLHQVAGPSCVLAWRNAALVWGSAWLTMLVVLFLSEVGDDGFAEPPLRRIFCMSLPAFIGSVRIDFLSMRRCIIPWLQKVKQMKVMGLPASFDVFFLISLLSTLLQAITIHTNAWFMITTVMSNDAATPLWSYVFQTSMLRWIPYNTPAVMAVIFWCLSLIQFFQPLAKGLPHFRGVCDKEAMVEVIADDLQVQDDDNKTLGTMSREARGKVKDLSEDGNAKIEWYSGLPSGASNPCWVTEGDFVKLCVQVPFETHDREEEDRYDTIWLVLAKESGWNDCVGMADKGWKATYVEALLTMALSRA